MKKSILPLLYAFGMMDNYKDYAGTLEERINAPRKVIKSNDLVAPIPNGAYQYWFREDGTFLSSNNDERMLKVEVVFSCCAMNDKNAIKKFDSWVKKNGQVS